jgi:hypothetical protein
MGWIDKKWFPRWPGDYCTGFYAPPEDGSAPIWERRDPDFQGTQDHSPKWVMTNGREIPADAIAMSLGGPDCRIERYGKTVPHRYYFASHFCRSHIVFLHDAEAVLAHLKGNKSVYGQLAKEGIVDPLPETKVEKPKVEVTENLAGELRAFLEPIIAANEKFVGLWKQGKVGPLVGAAMRENKGKYEGKFIEAMLKEIVGV